MNIYRKIYWFLYFIKRPEWWFRSFAYSYDFDKWMNEALNDPQFEESLDFAYTVILNNKKIWISNYPYAYCALESPSTRILPKRTTVIRFREAFIKWKIQEGI